MSATLSPARIWLRDLALRPALWRALGPVVLMLAGFGLADPVVLSPHNLLNIAIQASYLTILTTAQILVLLTRGFDLSIGMAVSLISVLAAMAMTGLTHQPVPGILLGIAVGISAGALIGAANGVLVAVVGINPFVATLGMFNILLALASTVSGGFPVFHLPAGFVWLFSQVRPLGIPVSILAAVGCVAVIEFVMRHSVFGRSLYLIGSNPEAARAAGIRSVLHLGMVYVLCSALAGFGALLLTARTASGEPDLGGSLALETIAAAVIGGTRLQGGEGSALCAPAGALFMTVLSNGMDLARINGYIQQLCVGAIILASLAIDNWTVVRRT